MYARRPVVISYKRGSRIIELFCDPAYASERFFAEGAEITVNREPRLVGVNRPINTLVAAKEPRHAAPVDV